MKILLVDDDEDEFVLLKGFFSFSRVGGAGTPTLAWAATYEEALAALSDPSYDVFLVDYRLGQKNGLDLLRHAAEIGCRAPIIVLTGQGDYEVDLAAMQLGAADYLDKPEINLQLLERSIRYALEQKKARNELEQRANEVVRLQDATATLLKTLELDALLTQILDAAHDLVPAAEKSWLYLSDVLSFSPGQIPGSGFSDERIHALNLERKAPGVPAEEFCAGNCVLVGDTQGGSFFRSFGYEVPPPGEARSVLVAPLVLEESAPAALALSSAGVSAFGEADRRLLATFAATATLALKNGLLHRREHTQAITDPLTGQLNRREFMSLGQREMERYHRYGHELSLILFDIDHLKIINDTYGHATGDQVIRTVADRCHAVLRQVDILGRLGGDEFAVIVPEVEKETEIIIAERIQHIIADAPIMTEAGPLKVSVSLGISRISQAAGDLSALLSLADKALYRAKSAGRGGIELANEKP